MPQTLYEFGGQGTILHMAVANGFPPQTYAPLLEPLTASCRVIALPPRPLWTNPPPPESVRSWVSLGDDLLAGLRERNLTDVIAVGHSFGGIGSMLAVLKEPSRFRALILLDPTILPQRTLWAAALARAFGQGERMPLVSGARKRRARFANVDEAYAYWRGKGLFRDWSDAAVRLYAESLTRPAANGGLELAWSPEWEAHYYKLIYTRSWSVLPRLRGLLPILTIRGTTTTTFMPPAAERMRRLLPDMDYAEIAGHGHLFPQSAPDETRAVIAAWLREKQLV